MNLLSANDFSNLKDAMLRHEEIELERTLGGQRMVARTFRVKAPWKVDMIVQIHGEHGHIAWIQNFINVEDARKACETN